MKKSLIADDYSPPEEHWVIADLHEKAGHTQTVPIPAWVKEAFARWTAASGITEGWIFRSINKAGKIWGDGMTPNVIWEVVKQAAQATGIEKLAPHDLRSTCARLCHLAGGENSVGSNSCSDMSRFKPLNTLQ